MWDEEGMLLGDLWLDSVEMCWNEVTHWKNYVVHTQKEKYKLERPAGPWAHWSELGHVRKEKE